MKLSCICTIAGLIVASPALLMADPSSECGIANSSQIEIGDCLKVTEKQVQGAIDQALKFARDSAVKLDDVTGRAKSAKALDAAQSVWTKYRDAQCDFVGTTYGGGSGTGIAIQSCRIELGRLRERELMSAVQ